MGTQLLMLRCRGHVPLRTRESRRSARKLGLHKARPDHFPHPYVMRMYLWVGKVLTEVRGEFLHWETVLATSPTWAHSMHISARLELASKVVPLSWSLVPVLHCLVLLGLGLRLRLRLGLLLGLANRLLRPAAVWWWPLISTSSIPHPSSRVLSLLH